MKIKNKNAKILVAVLICSRFFRIEALFVILCAALLLKTVENYGKLKIKLFNGKYIFCYFVVSGIILTVCYSVTYSYTTNHVIKDFVYVLMPLLFWLVGVNISYTKTKNNEDIKSCLYTAILISGIIYTCIDIISATYKMLTEGVMGASVYNLRSIIGTGDSLPIICLFLSIYIPEYLQLKRKWIMMANILFIVDAFIHFSRMNLLMIAILIAFSGIIKSYKTILKYGAVLVITIMLAYFTLPSYMSDFIDKIFSSFMEISYSQNTWDMTSVVHNWRGYEVYCALQKFNNASIFEKLFGAGFGSQLNVGRYAYLVSNEDTIPFLHNGYYTILMKWGIVGVIAYIGMLLSMFRTKIACKSENNLFKAIVVIIVTDTMFVHGLLFSPSVASLMLILAIIYILNRGYSK